jgi:hypothetical protein
VKARVGQVVLLRYLLLVEAMEDLVKWTMVQVAEVPVAEDLPTL